MDVAATDEVETVFDFLFFFSSRRRHTRLVSDWSSDVCSSDLLVLQIADGYTYLSDSLFE